MKKIHRRKFYEFLLYVRDWTWWKKIYYFLRTFFFRQSCFEWENIFHGYFFGVYKKPARKKYGGSKERCFFPAKFQEMVVTLHMVHYPYFSLFGLKLDILDAVEKGVVFFRAVRIVK